MTPIKLVISDVDGTLVTSDKRLTGANRDAVRRLTQAGIAFTIVSSRPPQGLRSLARDLALTAPMGAFNGGMIVGPQLEPIEQHYVTSAAAAACLEIVAAFDVRAWLYTLDAWIADNAQAPYVDHEKRTIQAEPVIVSDFAPYLAKLGKIVAVSDDFARLSACETAMQSAIGAQATVMRSQRYYLDITPLGVDKGTFVEAMSKRLSISRDAIAVVGDMHNDLAMFRKSGLPIAMGNADDRVKAEARETTRSNEDDGFAAAMDAFILRR